MAVLDFLFGGTAPTPATSTTTSSVQYPEWYTEYNKDVLGRAQAVANLPYAQYTGPRIAGFTPTEQTGFDITKQTAGAYKPFLGQASTALTGAMQTFPQAVGTYMNPYTENVVNKIADIGVRQLQEKFLPAVGQEFIKAGQFATGPGSSRMGEFGARALRDVQEGVLAEQAKALQSGYGQAADIFGKDVAAQRAAAGSAADIAGLAQKFGLGEAAAVGGVGSLERQMQQQNLDLAYKDFLAQQGYPKEQIQFLSGIAGGLKVPSSTLTSQVQMGAQPGSPSVASNLVSGAAGVNTLLGLFNKYFPSGAGSSGSDLASNLGTFGAAGG